MAKSKKGNTTYELQQSGPDMLHLRRENGDGVKDIWFPKSLLEDYAKERLTWQALCR